VPSSTAALAQPLSTEFAMTRSTSPGRPVQNMRQESASHPAVDGRSHAFLWIVLTIRGRWWHTPIAAIVPCWLLIQP